MLSLHYDRRAARHYNRLLPKVLRALAPTLKAALALNRQQIQSQIVAATATRLLDAIAVPALVVNAGGELHSANNLAKTLLERSNIIKLDGPGRVRLSVGFAAPQLNVVLQQIRSARTAQSHEIQVRSSEGVMIAILSIYPIVETLAGASDLVWLFAPERVALMLVREIANVPVPAEDLLRRNFRLTPAEARLSTCIAGGQSLESAADALRISKATARTQLKAAMGKTNTHRQTELAVLVLRLSLGPHD